MPTIESLEELLKHELKDLYSAETQITEALPKMIEASNNNDLKKALQQHLTVTKEQKKRLDDIQKLLGEEKAKPESKGFFANLFSSNEGEEHCKAMEGLIKEGDAIMSEDMSAEVMDAAIIAAAQKIEHYEISSYGTARAYALQLQLSKIAGLLEKTLNEEYEADDSLTKLALSKVNLDAQLNLQNAAEVKEKAASKTATKAGNETDNKKAAPKKAKAVKKSSKSTKTIKSKTTKK